MAKNKFYDSSYVPKNLEDLYNSGWKDYMLYYIRKYNLNDVNNSPEDLLQDMLVQMAETGYVEKYDPSISGFSGYLSVFIRNFMSCPYVREHHTGYGRLVNAVHINYSDVTEDSFDPHLEVPSSIIPNKDGDFTDYVCLMDSIENDLKQIKTKSCINYNGKTVMRSPLTVYKLLKEGYTIKDIAEIFGTSKQFVYTLRDTIRDVSKAYISA